jgi:hypothetical protein
MLRRSYPPRGGEYLKKAYFSSWHKVPVGAFGTTGVLRKPTFEVKLNGGVLWAVSRLVAHDFGGGLPKLNAKGPGPLLPDNDFLSV